MNPQTLHLPANDRIRENTSAVGNRRIDKKTRVALDAALESPATIRARLAELDTEWNVDRAVTMNFALIGAMSAFMAMRNLKKTGRVGVWGALFVAQSGFLVNHLVRGWCPPLGVFRRLGFRSANEIGEERVALEKRLAQLEV